MATYRVQDEHTGEDFDAADDQAAMEYGEQWLSSGDWPRSQTLYLDANVFRLPPDGDAELVGTASVELHPEEPKCSGEDHAWASPHSLLGGLKENPGVWGSGGGVRIKEVCRHCGAYKLTDTWATDPRDGSQGHTSVEYLEPDEESLAWIRKEASDE